MRFNRKWLFRRRVQIITLCSNWPELAFRLLRIEISGLKAEIAWLTCLCIKYGLRSGGLRLSVIVGWGVDIWLVVGWLWVTSSFWGRRLGLMMILGTVYWNKMPKYHRKQKKLGVEISDQRDQRLRVLWDSFSAFPLFRDVLRRGFCFEYPAGDAECFLMEIRRQFLNKSEL